MTPPDFAVVIVIALTSQTGQTTGALMLFRLLSGRLKSFSSFRSGPKVSLWSSPFRFLGGGLASGGLARDELNSMDLRSEDRRLSSSRE